MTSFKVKNISNPLALGEKLKEFREKKGLKLSQVARVTNVSVKYLEAIEGGRYSDLPGDIYAKSFLKVYTKFLGVNTKEFLDLYESESSIYRKTKASLKDFTSPVKKISRTHLLATPKIIRNGLVVVFVLAVLVYLGFRFQAIVRPPWLIVESPANNLVIHESFIDISGQVEPEATLAINGQNILVNEQGFFKELVDLQLGTNTIEIKATKRHGTQTQVYRQIVVIDDSQQGANLEGITN